MKATSHDGLFVAVLGATLGLACNHEHERARPASVMTQPQYEGDDDGKLDRTVRGSGPNSDPATDQSILARAAPATGGAPGLDSTMAGSGGLGGWGMAGMAGNRPVSN